MSGAAKHRTAVILVKERSIMYSMMQRYGLVKDSAGSRFARPASNETPCLEEPKVTDTSATIRESTAKLLNRGKISAES